MPSHGRGFCAVALREIIQPPPNAATYIPAARELPKYSSLCTIAFWKPTTTAKVADSESSGLNNIPNELLGQIGGYLDQGSLYSLALVCRHTKEPAYESLYQSYTNLDIEKPIVLFLRTIARRPDLAGKVKSITVRNWDAEGVALDRYIDEVIPYSAGISIAKYHEHVQQTMQTLEPRPYDEELAYYLLGLAQAAHLIPYGDWSRVFVLPGRFHIPDVRRSNQCVQFVRSLWNNVEDAYMVILL
jgi:hypothetical protein